MPVTSRRVVRFPKRHGWTELRQRGSHLVLFHHDFQDPVVVPMHAGDMSKGTFLQILKDAGFTLADYHNG